MAFVGAAAAPRMIVVPSLESWPIATKVNTNKANLKGGFGRCCSCGVLVFSLEIARAIEKWSIFNGIRGVPGDSVPYGKG